MTYGQIVGLTFIVFGQIIVLMLVSRFASLVSVLAHEDIRKRGCDSKYISDAREVDMNTPDDNKDRIIGFK